MSLTISLYQDVSHHYTTASKVLYEIGHTYYLSGRLADAQHLLHTSLQLFTESEAQSQDRLPLLLLYGQVLLVDYLLSRDGVHSELMFATLQQARELAEAANLQQSLADALSLLGLAHHLTALMAGAIIDTPQSGKYQQSLAYQQQALELREKLSDTRGMSESLFQIGAIYERWQQYDQARAYYTQARQLADQYNHLFEKSEPARHTAIHALMEGKLDEALTFALQALELREAAHFRPYQPLDHLLLRDIYQLQGKMADAQRHGQEATTLATAMGYPTLITTITDIMERLAAAQK